MKKLFLIIIIVPLFLQCSKDEKDEPDTITTISDARFNGKFSGWEGYWETPAMHYQNYTWFVLEFNGTTKVENQSQKVEYDVKMKSYSFVYEFETNAAKTQYRRRLWNNRYDDWTEWLNYNFSDGDSILTIQWYGGQTKYYKIGKNSPIKTYK